MSLFGAIDYGDDYDHKTRSNRSWQQIPHHFPHVAIDQFVMMPKG